MSGAARSKTIVTALGLAAAAAFGTAAQELRPAEPPDRPAARSTAAWRAAQYGGQVRALLPLLGRGPDAATLGAAIADIRRAVAEIDQAAVGETAGAQSFFDPTGVRATAASAHLHLALFLTRARDYDEARREVGRARDILGSMTTAPDFRVAWSATPAGGPGEAPTTTYQTLALGDFETLLAESWSRSRAVTLDLNTTDERERAALRLDIAEGVFTRDADRPLVERASADLAAAVAAGARTVDLALPPGTYRIAGRAGAGLDRSFVVPEAADPDPVVLGADRFALAVEPADRTRGPRFFLNGVEVRDLGAMPYGTYRVVADEGYVKDVPSVIRFIPGLGIDNRSRSTWSIFVPRGERTVLRFGATALGGRLR